ncbi:allantoinase AllB [Haloferula sargassicola]|uniref:Allantoinase n=1 Tax=Haloferula sargassicola TaxID=490096 RepID=A0ABP9UU34_9BACT
MHDLLVHARTPDGAAISLAASGGTITDVGPSVTGSAREEIEAPNAILLPSWIDAHVHFNEPGREHWEGLDTGSLALAAGGGTVFFDMPLNSSPPVTTRGRFEEKHRIAERKSHVDFALWGGLIPDSLPHLADMAAAGAIGFKAFMCHSGLDEFPTADAATLREGMRIAADLHLPVAVHAEIPKTIDVSGKDMAAWLASRPIGFELDAIRRALDLAHDTGCALHIVHVTCAEGIDLVTEAKAAGIDVTVETCPHYLLLTDTDAIRIGAPAKCAPPLRTTSTVEALWQRLLSGNIDTLGSDHSPSSPDLKTGDDLFAIWGGIAGIQHGLPLLCNRGFDFLPQISANVATRFRLPNKGGLLPGHDADFILLEKNTAPIAEPDLLTRHKISPYLGLTPRYRITTTHLRGQKVTPQTRGRFIYPEH